MSKKKLTDSERIRALLEEVSTPETTSECDPYSDDGEYGSDEEFLPNFNDLSSSDNKLPRSTKSNV